MAVIAETSFAPRTVSFGANEERTDFTCESAASGRSKGKRRRERKKRKRDRCVPSIYRALEVVY